MGVKVVAEAGCMGRPPHHPCHSEWCILQVMYSFAAPLHLVILSETKDQSGREIAKEDDPSLRSVQDQQSLF